MAPALGFVTEEGGRNAKNYKYAGQDLSLIYKYFASPFAAFLVTLLPRWLAPNTITLIGLGLITASHAVLAYYSPGLVEPAPGWVYVMQAVCLFMYSTLDNMDGKQARRTGSSSPLGLLFDHGCDAVNAGILSATSFCCALGTGTGFSSYLIFLSVIWPFYCCSWEEFHVHEFILPIINGPNEGILATILVYLYTAYAGVGWPDQDLAFGYKLFDLLMLLAVLPAAGTVVGHFATVFNKLSNSKTGGSLVDAFARLLPVLSVSLSGALWMYLSPAFVSDHIRTFYFSLGAVFADSVMKLLLANVCQQPFVPSYLTLTMLWLGPLNAQFGFMSESTMLYTLLAASFANVSLFVVVGINELKAALNVYCFTIKPKA